MVSPNASEFGGDSQNAWSFLISIINLRDLVLLFETIIYLHCDHLRFIFIHLYSLIMRRELKRYFKQLSENSGTNRFYLQETNGVSNKNQRSSKNLNISSIELTSKEFTRYFSKQISLWLKKSYGSKYVNPPILCDRHSINGFDDFSFRTLSFFLGL